MYCLSVHLLLPVCLSVCLPCIVGVGFKGLVEDGAQWTAQQVENARSEGGSSGAAGAKLLGGSSSSSSSAASSTAAAPPLAYGSTTEGEESSARLLAAEDNEGQDGIAEPDKDDEGGESDDSLVE